jgi:flagellin-specific chaperone FliS
MQQTAENTAEKTEVVTTVNSSMPTSQLTTEQSIEEMEFEQALALERAENLKKAIAEAKVEKRKEDLHKIAEILDNLSNQFGEDFTKVVSEKFASKQIIVLSDSKEIEDYEKFTTLVERGYRVVDGEVMGKRNEPINCTTINSQITNEPKVLMNVPKFKTLFAKFM